MFLCLLHVVVSPLEGVVGPRFEKEVLAFDGHERVECFDASETAAERYCQQAPTDGDDGNENNSCRRQRCCITHADEGSDGYSSGDIEEVSAGDLCANQSMRRRDSDISALRVTPSPMT